MIIRGIALALSVAFSACNPIMPNRNDPSAPRLEFRIYYAQPRFASRATAPVVTTRSMDADRCVYVASPFAVLATASDDGGIASIIVGPTAPAGLTVRSSSTELFALPPADTPQTHTDGSSFPNPGVVPRTNDIRVTFPAGRAYDGASLFGTYEFAAGANVAALRATVRNFGATADVAEVFNFYVRRAGQGSSEQAGAECRQP